MQCLPVRRALGGPLGKHIGVIELACMEDPFCLIFEKPPYWFSEWPDCFLLPTCSLCVLPHLDPCPHLLLLIFFLKNWNSAWGVIEPDCHCHFHFFNGRSGWRLFHRFAGHMYFTLGPLFCSLAQSTTDYLTSCLRGIVALCMFWILILYQKSLQIQLEPLFFL